MKPRAEFRVRRIRVRAAERTILCLAWLAVWVAGAADSSSPRPVAGPDQAGYLFQQFVPVGPVTNWWHRPEAELRAAAPTNADAGIALARQLLAGEDRHERLGEARRLIAATAAAGHVQGLYLMGWLELNQTPSGAERVVQNFGVASEWFEQAAEAGSARAALQLGELFYLGKLERDYRLAEKWFLLAAERGHVGAMNRLAEMYRANHRNFDGSAFPEQSAEAAKWRERAGQEYARQAALNPRPAPASTVSGRTNATPSRVGPLARPFPPAQGVTMGDLLELADDETRDLLRRAATNSQSLARIRGEATNRWPLSTNVASGLRQGLPTVDDLPQVQERVAAAQKLEGEAKTPADFERALLAYARLGGMPGGRIENEAMAGMIRIYASGRLAAEAELPRPSLPGDPARVTQPEVRFRLAELLWRGNSVVAADPTSAVAWFVRAAQAGSAPAMRRLGEFWEQGVNGEPDPAEAQRWFRRAELAERGSQREPASEK